MTTRYPVSELVNSFMIEGMSETLSPVHVKIYDDHKSILESRGSYHALCPMYGYAYEESYGNYAEFEQNGVSISVFSSKDHVEDLRDTRLAMSICVDESTNKRYEYMIIRPSEKATLTSVY